MFGRLCGRLFRKLCHNRWYGACLCSRVCDGMCSVCVCGVWVVGGRGVGFCDYDCVGNNACGAQGESRLRLVHVESRVRLGEGFKGRGGERGGGS